MTPEMARYLAAYPTMSGDDFYNLYSNEEYKKETESRKSELIELANIFEYNDKFDITNKKNYITQTKGIFNTKNKEGEFTDSNEKKYTRDNNRTIRRIKD